MKKTKIIIPALGMLLLSTAASVTGTVAWFSMSNYVTATNMNIKAKAEKGIVISNEAQSAWKDSAEASHVGPIAVRPTSTVTGATWCHSTSNNADSALNTGNVEQVYTMLTGNEDTTKNIAVASDGAGYIDDNGHSGYDAEAGGSGETAYEADSKYYLKNSFHLKSSAEAITATPVYVNNVTVTGTNTSEALDAALRVLIVSGSSSLVYAPVTGATLSYSVWTGSSKTSVVAINPAATTTTPEDNNAGRDQTLLSSTTIPAYSATGANSTLQIDIYLYFEGEDPACKSTNIAATLDNLTVSVKFATVKEFTHPQA